MPSLFCGCSRPLVRFRRRIIVVLAIVTLSVAVGTARCANAADQEARLLWGSGDAMTGRLLGVTPTELTWQSPLFSEPVRIATSVLSAVRFAPEDSVLDEADEFRFTLHNGDTLFGQLIGIDENHLTIASSRHGDVRLPRHVVGAVRRVNHDGLIYLGPAGRAGWSTATGRAGLDAWKEEADGALSTDVVEASLVRTLRAEKRLAMEVVLRFTERPDFTLALGQGDDASLRLETWDDTLVALAGFDFKEVQVVDEKTAELLLHLYVDFETGRMLVYGPSGRRLAETSDVDLKNIPRTLTLRNGNSGVTLQHLRVARWNGHAVDSLAEGEIGIQLISGDVQRGRLESLDNGTIVLNSEGKSTTISLDEINMLAVTPAENDPRPAAESAAVRIKWRDGGMLSGDIVSINREQAILQPTWGDELVTAVAAGMQSIQLTPTEEPAEDPDQLKVQGETLRGQLIVEDGERPILWKPVGGLNGVALSSDGDGVIIRGAAAKELSIDATQYPDVIYLVNDDVIPCRLEQVSEKAVQLSSPFIDAKEVSSRDIKAVEISSSGRAGSRGFADPEWKRIRGKASTSKGEVTLSSGSFGHPSAMTGEQIRFRMQWPNSYTVLTIHLFADNLRRPKTSTAVTFIMNQQTLYVSGDKLDPRNPFAAMQNPHATRVFTQLSTNVEMLTKGGRLHVLLDGKSAHEMPLNQDGAGHSGILFELNQGGGGAVFFNGNVRAQPKQQVRQLTLSDFHSRTDSGISIRQFIEEESRRRTLTIPRFRRDDPPTHVLIAPNGDLLRGRLLNLDNESVTFASRLEEFHFARDRVASIVWLHDPKETENEKNDAADKEPPARRPDNEIQALLDGGFILSFTPEVLAGGILKGQSSGLAARCLVPAASILELYMGDPEQRRERAVYGDWNAQSALEPDWDIAQSDGGNATGSELIGEAAPLFELPQLDGKTFRLEDHRGTIVVLDFWATWCGPCVLALPDYIDATRDFDGSKLVLVAVNLEESSQQVRAFLKEKELEVRVALDGSSAVASDYQVNGIPHTVIIGPDGTVEYVHVGYDSDGGEELHRIASEILAGTWDRDAEE